MGPGAQEETVATNLNQNFNTFINSTILLLLYNNNVYFFGPENTPNRTIIRIIYVYIKVQSRSRKVETIKVLKR